jgi:disulfide bond formation protein DsbB
MTTIASPPVQTAAGIDPRGPQLTAGVTAVVLAVVLLLPSPWAGVLAGVQAVLFAIGAIRGVQHTPHAWVFRTVVRPRLAPPDELEAPAPPRFAQGVGLAFALVALVGFTTGLTLLGQVAIGFARVAALLNAVFRLCLGCELYLLMKRFAPIGG